MSELRQRRGEIAEEERVQKDTEIAKLQAELETLRKEKEDAESEAQIDVAAEVRRFLENSLSQPEKSLSNRAKECKLQLEGDPMNLHFIFELGITYAQDEHWERCCNVLLRGWKRVSEFNDKEAKHLFLSCLAQASRKSKKFRQALAVLRDMDKPDDKERAAQYQELRCQVLCENGDVQTALKAWNEAIEGQPFEQVLFAWAKCCGPLAAVGASEMVKSSLSELAEKDEDWAKVEAVERLVSLRDEITVRPHKPWSRQRKSIVAIVAFVFTILFLFLLHRLEYDSLSKLKFKS